MSGCGAADLREILPSANNIGEVVERAEKPSTYHILYVRRLLLQPVVGATVYRVTKTSQLSPIVSTQVVYCQLVALQIAHFFIDIAMNLLRRKSFGHLAFGKIGR
jgi:hypothetical protein